MERIVTAHTPMPPGALVFRAMHGHEGLSQLFEFDVELLATSYSLDMKQLLGKPLTLEIETSGLDPRYLNGQITRCVLAGQEGGTTRHYVYRATVRPWLWYLTQTSDNKIFQNKSVPDVIREVLADYPFPVTFELADSYRTWEYCVQYQETDFAFISRLMEHEGIYYWFRHENGKHTLVLTDDVTQHERIPSYETIPYYDPDRTATPQEEHISGWEVSEQITPGAFATNDYDFKTPGALMEARRNNPGPYDNANLEVYEWLGGYTNPGDAERYTRTRLEALQCHQEQVSGSANVRGMSPGYLFVLRGHPRQSENREYLVIGTRYRIREGGLASGASSGLFDVDFTVLPSSLQYRAPRVTPQPRTHGPQTAKVVGKQAEEIWTDNYGRVKVQFHWDRYGQRNENSSCWVRVSSPWAGGGFGGIQLPRVGDEVIVDFIGGHPDRPIIVGRVYNAGNMPPWELPGNATQSGFLSRTKEGTPRTANAFMFEDKSGQEEIWLHAERNLRTEVEGDEFHDVDGNRTTNIGVDDTTNIYGHRNITVTKTDTLYVGEDRTVTIDGAETHTVKDARTVHVKDGLNKETFDTGLHVIVTADGEKREITGDFDETITGPSIRTITETSTETIGDTEERTITGDSTTTYETNQTVNVTGGSSVHDVSENVTITAGGTINISGGDVIDITTPANITINADGADVIVKGNNFRDETDSRRVTRTGAHATFVGANAMFAGANFSASGAFGMTTGVSLFAHGLTTTVAVATIKYAAFDRTNFSMRAKTYIISFENGFKIVT